MNRDIKFRAWDRATSQWVTAFTMTSNGYVELFYHDGSSGKSRPTPDFEVVQYTGLKDKNGVEIYEGDIVGLVHKKHGLQNTKKIVWDEVHACFDWEDANGDSWPDGFTGFYDEYEVIGNIYEHPELLEAKS